MTWVPDVVSPPPPEQPERTRPTDITAPMSPTVLRRRNHFVASDPYTTFSSSIPDRRTGGLEY
ncbi:hypothetical protein MTOK_21110 [Mycolicibacterium tokaiense]|nr:hypothetical protein MTOK_21110 [Mycolicibacterium tokaiense]